MTFLFKKLAHKTWRLLLFYLLFTAGIQAQERPGIKWQSIETDHFEIIYPPEYEEKAIEYATILETLYPDIGDSAGDNPDHITIILNNEYNIGNGYVAYFPRHSRYFHTPANGSVMHFTDWEELLAIHELRHVAQLDAANKNMNKVYYILFGETGLGVAKAVSTPSWFSEGDSVFMETALTDFGRGRNPTFWMITRTQLLSNQNYEYSQHLLGSDTIGQPNPYEMGFLFTSYLREKYGQDAISNIILDNSNRPFNPYGFSLSVKKTTGKNLKNTYEEMKNYYSNQWKLEDREIRETGLTKTTSINSSKTYLYTAYRSPQVLPGGRVIALKHGKGQPSIIVETQNSKDKYLFAISDNVNSISANEAYIIWGEWNPDKRWIAGHSHIGLYSFEKKQTDEIKFNGELYEPAIAQDSNHLAAIEILPDGQCRLVVSPIQKIERRYILQQPEYTDCPNEILWSEPYPYEGGKKVVLIQFAKEGKQLAIVDIPSGKVQPLMKPSQSTLFSPFYRDGIIYFRSGANGVDNIYAITPGQTQANQMTNVRFGAFDPFIFEKELYFSEYSADGYFLKKAPLKTIQTANFNRKPVSPVQEETFRQEGPIFNQRKKSGVKPEPRKYQRLQNSMHVHSWDLSPMILTPYVGGGFTSQNLLNTIGMSARYAQHPHNGSYQALGSLFYQKFYPVIGISGEASHNMILTTEENGDITTTGQDAQGAGAFVELPFYISNGANLHYLSVKAIAQYRQFDLYGSDNLTFEDEEKYEANDIGGEINYFLQRKGAQTILQGFPTVEFSMLLHYHTNYLTDQPEYRQFSVLNRLSLGGLLYRHKFNFYGGFEQSLNTDFKETGLVRMPLGYAYFYFPQVWLGGISYTSTFNSPGLNILNVLYLRNPYLTCFFEIGEGKTSNNTTNWKSYGTTLDQPFAIFNKPYFFNLQLTYAYTPKENQAVIYYGVNILLNMPF